MNKEGFFSLRKKKKQVGKVIFWGNASMIYVQEIFTSLDMKLSVCNNESMQ